MPPRFSCPTTCDVATGGQRWVHAPSYDMLACHATHASSSRRRFATLLPSLGTAVSHTLSLPLQQPAKFLCFMPPPPRASVKHMCAPVCVRADCGVVGTITQHRRSLKQVHSHEHTANINAHSHACPSMCDAHTLKHTIRPCSTCTIARALTLRGQWVALWKMCLCDALRSKLHCLSGLSDAPGTRVRQRWHRRHPSCGTARDRQEGVHHAWAVPNEKRHRHWQGARPQGQRLLAPLAWGSRECLRCLCPTNGGPQCTPERGERGAAQRVRVAREEGRARHGRVRMRGVCTLLLRLRRS